MATKDVEDGIRAYLDSLSKPAPKPVVDREAVRALKAQAKAEPDPINKLKLLAQAEEAGKPKMPDAEDTSGLEAVFVAEAKGWADEEGIPVSAFQALKVPDDVLRRAGFSVGVAKPSVQRASGGTRARLSLDDVKAAIDDMGDFTITTLSDRLGASHAAVAGKVKQLIDEDHVVEKGDAPKPENQRGRPATLYGKP